MFIICFDFPFFHSFYKLIPDIHYTTGEEYAKIFLSYTLL